MSSLDPEHYRKVGEPIPSLTSGVSNHPGSTIINADQISQLVQRRYGGFARAAAVTSTSCCHVAQAPTCCGAQQGLYTAAELAQVPALARDLSRGCGNPTGFANLVPGEIVVDLGCGGGIDLVLAAHRLGPAGQVIGVDFTPEMIQRATEVLDEAGLAAPVVELRLAGIDATGLPDGVADVVISNCVINLCADKEAVYREVYRILKPGGRLAISDILLVGELEPGLRSRFMANWPGCLGGAMPEARYFATLVDAGFRNVRVFARHALHGAELDEMASCPGKPFTLAPATEDLAALGNVVESVKFIAVKPFSNSDS